MHALFIVSPRIWNFALGSLMCILGKLVGIGSQEERFGYSGDFFLGRRYSSKEKEASASLL